MQTTCAPGPPQAQACPEGHALGSLGFAVQSRPPLPVDPVLELVVPVVDDEVVIDDEVVPVVEPLDVVEPEVAVAVEPPPAPPGPSVSSPQPAPKGTRTKETPSSMR